MTEELSATNPPREVRLFETLAFMAALFGLLGTLAAQGISMWAFVVPAVQVVLVYWISRHRSAAGRLVWSGLMLLFLAIIIVGFCIIIKRGMTLPSMSGLNLLISFVTGGCNIAAAIYLWSASTSEWLARRA